MSWKKKKYLRDNVGEHMLTGIIKYRSTKRFIFLSIDNFIFVEDRLVPHSQLLKKSLTMGEKKKDNLNFH